MEWRSPEEEAERYDFEGKAKETNIARKRAKAVNMVRIRACVNPCIQGLTQNNIR